MTRPAARGQVAGDEHFADHDDVAAVATEILRPVLSALLIVDVQNDYCHPDGALGRAGFDLSTIDPMVDVVEGLIAVADHVEVPVILLRSEHSALTDSPAWRRKTRHSLDICREGTWGAEFYRLKPRPDDTVVVKHRYSGFIGTDLPQILAATVRSTLVVVGTATNVCVESTVRDATMMDYDIVVVEDGVAATDPHAHRASLENMERFFGQVLSSDRVRAIWSAARTAQTS